MEFESGSQFEDEELAEILLRRVATLNTQLPDQGATPRRFVEALKQLTTPEVFKFTTFESDVQNMVVVKDIDFATLCEHHVLPFIGVAHVGYIPDGKVVGLSKIPRLVEQHCRALNTQEELTERIAQHMMVLLNPLGVAVVMEAHHTCMSIRGAKALRAMTRTASMLGVFSDHDRTAKAEFMESIR